MKSYIFFNRTNRSVYIGIEFEKPIPRDEFSDVILQVISSMLSETNPLHHIRIVSVNIDDIPDNLERILNKIGPFIQFRLQVYFGNQRRRTRHRPWSKRPIKQLALIHVGKFVAKKGFIYYIGIPVWYTFQKTLSKINLS